MEPLIAAVTPYHPKDCHHFFRPDKFYYELDVWETDFEDPQETAFKIEDLRYALECGFDLKKHVMDYIVSLPRVPGYQEPVRSAFRRYIMFMRTGVGKSGRGYKDVSVDILSTEEMVQLFCKEALVYKNEHMQAIVEIIHLNWDAVGISGTYWEAVGRSGTQWDNEIPPYRIFARMKAQWAFATLNS